MKVSETLNRAADLIQERGWAQGAEGWGLELKATADGPAWESRHNDDGPLCLEGGIYAALGAKYMVDHWVSECPAFQAVQRYLGRRNLWVYNDYTAQSAEDVIGVLRAAAVIEEAKEKQEVSA